MWPFKVAIETGRCFLMFSEVRPGHVRKLPFFIVLMNVDVTGLKQHA